MNKRGLRVFIENISGYWFHKIKDLPIGADLRIDINSRFGHKKIDIIFDVGANTGQTYNQFKRAFPKATIFCFEPVDTTFARLIKNVSANKNTILENFAFGEIVEEKKIRLFENWDGLNSLNEEAMNPSPGAPIQTVIINTIDNYCAVKNITEIDLLKIDTEGYEINVLKGAKRLLEKKLIAFLYCEVGFLKSDKRHTNFSELAEFLATFNYYFIAMYNGSSDDWKQGFYFGNALFGHTSLKMGNFA